jgi:hypothetical protein
MKFVGPALGACVFVALMSLVPHPARRNLNAIFAAGAVGVYIGGGFGVWELIYPVLATPVIYLGLRSYRAIGIAWLMHAAWDLPHHLIGHPIWPYVPTLVSWLHDLRLADRRLVPGGRTFDPAGRDHGTNPLRLRVCA